MSDDLLLLRAGSRLCGIRVQSVDETMRPMPVESVPDLPAFVRGVCVVRGRPTPIVDLGALLAEGELSSPKRLVVLRLDQSRRVGLLVDEVLGIRDGRALLSEELPPLLQNAAGDAIEALGRLDRQLLMVLSAGRLLPAEVWARVSSVGAA